MATQLAEQSFDVDADLLITDLALVDLLLQRVGRLHRHEDTWRPDRLRVPRLFVTGFEPREGRDPAFAFAGEMIYGRHLLLRTAAVLPGAGEVWSVPGDVPGLVEKVYGADASLLPEAWQESREAACREQENRDRARAEEARQFLLTPQGEHERRTLAGLVVVDVAAADDHTAFAFQQALASRWATATTDRTTHDPGQPGVRLRCYLDLRQDVAVELTLLPAVPGCPGQCRIRERSRQHRR
ncbi:hypothetical protein GCM10010255_12160 [Streptomyces coeruleofuscus]|uniref:CRISPR-associated nuclease/helicase Cas3 domain-containing protein n=1 Tax=Streptomyces coeruleofuscus TaxID=66879 RepID=A0ABN3HS09_9ACTN